MDDEKALELLTKRENICRFLLAAAGDDPLRAVDDFHRARITTRDFLTCGPDDVPHDIDRGYSIVAETIAIVARGPIMHSARRWQQPKIALAAVPKLIAAGLWIESPRPPAPPAPFDWSVPHRPPWTFAGIIQLLTAVNYSPLVVRRGIAALRAIDAAIAVARTEWTVANV